ncbi:MAG: hypothetical protein V4682_01185 [Patescibacteria group bacterium]
MTPSTKRIVTAAVLIALGIAIGLGIAFATQRMQDFDRMMDAREAAPDKEKFDRDFEAMADWLENYKHENPSATDEDAKRAFEEIWKK